MNNHRSFVNSEPLPAPASAAGAQPTQSESQKPRRRRRSSAVLIESAINGINILRRSLQDEIDSAEEEESDWNVSSSSSDDSSRLALKDVEADSEFTEGMSKYFDGNDSGATIHFSRTVEMRQAIQEDVAACALFEDEAILQRHERQLRHAKLCLDDMAGKPAQNDPMKKMADSALLEDFISPSTRRINIEKSRNETDENSDNGSGYSLPMGYSNNDELEGDESSCSDSFLLDAQANRRLCATNCSPVMTKGNDANYWKYPVKQGTNVSKLLADTDSIPEQVEVFAAKAQSSVANFHSSCVSDLCWDSAASFDLGSEELRDLHWAAANVGRAVAAEKAPPMMRRSSMSRAA